MITDIAWKSSIIYDYTFVFLFVLLFLLNSCTFSYYQGKLLQWPFFVLSFYYFCELLTIILRKFTKRNEKLKVEQYTSRASRNFILGLQLMLLLITLFSIRDVVIQTLVFFNQELLKVALELTTIIAFLVLLSFKYITNIRNTWLEDFEKKIIIDDLSVKQIRTKFIEGFLGKQTLDWLHDAENEILKKVMKYKKYL